MAFRMISVSEQKHREQQRPVGRDGNLAQAKEYLSHRLRYRGVESNDLLFRDELVKEVMSQNRLADLDMLHTVFAKIKHQLGESAVYAEAWREFKSRHTDILWTEAIIQRLDELQHHRILDGEWPDEDVFVTSDALEQLLPQLRGGELQLTPEAERAQAAEQARQNLINEILGAAPPLITGTNDREAERAKRLAREEWIGRIKSMDIESLQRVRAKQLLKSGSAEGAKQIVKQADAEQRQALYDQRFKPLPPTYVPPSKDESCGVPWTPLLLKKLPAQELSRLTRLYGPNLDAVLQGRN